MLEFDFDLHKGPFHLQAKEHLASAGFTVIQGRSGCGKTTLLRCIAGLEPEARGELRVFGRTWQAANVWLPPHKRALGYVPQDPTLFPNRSVRGNLDYGRRRTPDRNPALSFDQVVGMLELEELLERRPDQLSGGQQQRVAIGRALLSSPSLLLMDEPLASLDLQSKAAILPYLDRLADTLELPVLYVTHSPQEAARLANELLIMDAGRVTRRGRAEDLLSALDTDISHRADAHARLTGTVSRHDDEYGLTWVQVEDQPLALHRLTQPPGTRVALQVAARDVSIALSRAADTSVVNLLECQVDELVGDPDPAYAIVRLRMGSQALLARISTYSARRLALGPGMKVVAQVKAISL